MDRITEQVIRRAARNGTLSHAVIFSGDGDLSEAARFYAAALLCRESGGPCLRCPACSKVLRDIHPDVLTAEDSEHKDLSVDVLRKIRAEAFVCPNEGSHKVFLFPDCRRLTVQDQNVLLKLVEEGPSYAAFIFCAENISALLPTVRSRCVEYTVRGQEAPAELLPEAETLLEAMADGAASEMSRILAGFENGKMQREKLQQVLTQCYVGAEQALRLRCGVTPDAVYAEAAGKLSRRLKKRQLLQCCEMLGKFARECEWNVGAAHVLGGVLAEWEEIL